MISRKTAKANGQNWYFTGKPCKNGHIDKHHVAGGCFTCRTLHGAKWREDHSEEIKTYQQKWHKETYTTEKRRESYKRNIKTSLLNAARGRAKKRGMEFTITVDDIHIPDVCPVLGMKLDRPHLDRLDNSKGYIPGNVFVISKRANRLKSDGTLEEFKKIVDFIQGRTT